MFHTVEKASLILSSNCEQVLSCSRKSELRSGNPHISAAINYSVLRLRVHFGREFFVMIHSSTDVEFVVELECSEVSIWMEITLKFLVSGFLEIKGAILSDQILRRVNAIGLFELIEFSGDISLFFFILIYTTQAK